MIGMNLAHLEPVERLPLATMLSFEIDPEREFAGQAAGERTHALVALGVAAGVVNGLGFLSGGTIQKTSGTRRAGPKADHRGRHLGREHGLLALLTNPSLRVREALVTAAAGDAFASRLPSRRPSATRASLG